MLTDEQDQEVERLQAGALKCIYGFEMSYAMMREKVGVSTLRERRVQACDKFANKCIGNDRFNAWFPLKATGRSGMRKGEVFKEEYARCKRLLDTPMFYMRRRMNGKPGKVYGERNKIYRDTETDHIRTGT